MVKAVRNLLLLLLISQNAIATDDASPGPPRAIRDESRLQVFELKVSLKNEVATIWGNPESSRFKQFQGLVLSSEMMPRIITQMNHTNYEYVIKGQQLFLERNCSAIVKNQQEAETFIDQMIRALVNRIKLLIMGQQYEVIIRGSCLIYGLEHNEAMVRHLGVYLRYREKGILAESLGIAVHFTE